MNLKTKNKKQISALFVFVLYNQNT